MNRIDLKHLASYEEDFALWAAEQGALLRAGKLDRVDIENVAEEIESLGRNDQHQIVSRLTIILIHLLKWQHQPRETSNSWASSIVTGRDEIAGLIERSPSLAAYPASVLERAYRRAPRVASLETGLPLSAFPKTCPYTAEQVLDENFWPGHPPA